MLKMLSNSNTKQVTENCRSPISFLRTGLIFNLLLHFHGLFFLVVMQENFF
jgi:hypothetical protein